MGSIWDADYDDACGNSKWEVNSKVCWNNSILLFYMFTSIFNALKIEVCKVIPIHQCNRMLKYNIKYIVTYCSAADICIWFIQVCRFLDSSGGREGEREMFSVERVIQKRWKCMQKIYILAGASMCPIGHFVTYSPSAVFWFLSEHCPPWNCNDWHWSV
jgi:hypothetical protein